MGPEDDFASIFPFHSHPHQNPHSAITIIHPIHANSNPANPIQANANHPFLHH